MSFFPTSADDIGRPEGEPRVVGLEDDDATDLLGALSSDTARQILLRLEESPRPPSALAESLDTTVQNVHYHLDRLSEAGAVEVIDTVYSERGREMAVYAPAADPLVIVGGSESEADVKSILSRLLGAIGFLAIVSVLIQWLLPSPADPAIPQGGSYGAVPTATPPPIGMYVFVGGLAVVLAVAGLWYLRHRS